VDFLLKTIIQLCIILAEVIFVSTGRAVSQDPLYPAQIVKIGLLIQDSSRISAVQGAELAVRIANKTGGMNGRPFQLVVRSMEGPWGTGSKQAVNLIFEEKVWALIGSHDGRNAHLVEQAATKATVVFVSAWAADPTLSQAFVPWFFNCVPNDLQQSAELVEEIYDKRNINKVAIVSDNDYDSKQALKNFLKKTKLEGKVDPLQLLYENFSENLKGLIDQIKKTDIGCIILFCKPSTSLKIIQQIRQRKMNQPVFGSLYILNENELSDPELQNFDDFMLVASGKWSYSKDSVFMQEYQRVYGNLPGAVAAYAFDGMNLLIEAIRKAGVPDREKIQKSLQNIHYNGITGLIRFDDTGNRIGNFKTTATKNGLPVAIE
jgi:branched-chain amino acid transport system substrate-binding protein